MVSPHRATFVKTMPRLCAERDGVSVVAVRHGCPIFAADFAAALEIVTPRLVVDRGAPTGIFHCVNAGETMRHGFAEAVVAGPARRGCRNVPVSGIPTSAYPTPARRPANSVLSTERLETVYGIPMRPWQVVPDDILDRLVSPAATGV